MTEIRFQVTTHPKTAKDAKALIENPVQYLEQHGVHITNPAVQDSFKKQIHIAEELGVLPHANKGKKGFDRLI